jgi:hypothetical protein
MRSQRWLRSSVVLAGMVVTLSAQTSKPTFEVASIRRNLSGPSLPTLSVRPASLERFQKAELIAKLSRDIADAATKEALDRWPPKRAWDQNLGSA